MGCVLGLALGVFAGEQSLTVGYLEYPPYAYRAPSGQMQGFVYELLEGAAKKAGLQLRWRYSPEGPEKGLEQQKFQIWFGAFPTEERRARFHLTRPFWQTDWVLLVDRKLEIHSLEEIRGQWISVPDIRIHRFLFSSKLALARARYFAQPEEVLSAVCRGETAGMFADIHYLHALLLRRPAPCRQTDFRFVTVPGAVLEVSLMANRETARLADLLREGIDHLALSGETSEILTRYLAGASGGTKFLVEAVERYRARLATSWMLSAAGLLLSTMAVFIALLRRKNQTISLALTQAQEANRVKTQFLANMSHELRTPMNGILGTLELLASSPLSAEQSDYVRTARACGESLLRMLSDILEFSQLRTSKVQLNCTRFSLETVIQEAVALCDPVLASKPNLRILVNYPARTPTSFYGDEKKIQKVLTSLLANACKFTHQGSVCISARYLNGQLRLAVADTGIGIPPNQQASIFEVFHQLDGSNTRRYSGAGLGLSLSKMLVDSMNGTISVRSEPGKGSEFSIEIPLETYPEACDLWSPFAQSLRVWIGMQNPEARAVLENYLQAWGCEICDFGQGPTPDRILVDHPWASANRSNLFNVPLERVLLVGHASDSAFWATAGIRILSLASTPSTLREEIQKPVATPPEPSPVQAPVARRILLVEDNAVNRRVACGMLKKLGCEIEVAENGLIAVEMCQQNRYDLILMDCQMPIMDGYEATRRIRQSGGRNCTSPIIALTANALPEDVERCLAAGMNSHLAKPVSLDALRRALCCDYHELPASFSLSLP